MRYIHLVETMIDPALAESVRYAFGEHARVTQITNLVGDASTRLYQRIALSAAPVPTAIAMRLPPDALHRSDEIAKGLSGNELPFSNMLRAARARNIRVPALYADLTGTGNFTVLLEDLGDETLFVRLGRTPRDQWLPWYLKAIDLLVDWQRAFARQDPECIAFHRRFDRDLLRWELDHFRQWALEAWRGPVPASLRAALDTEFDTLADELTALPTTVVHRDWQSKNLMVLGDGSLAVIDFQDGLMGPLPYDLVALLCDSYTSLEPEEQSALIAHYFHRTGMEAPAERERFVRWFYLQTVQRKLKDAGRFVFIHRVRNNPNFLPYIPQSVRYVHRALIHLPDRARLHALLAEIAPDWFGPSAPK